MPGKTSFTNNSLNACPNDAKSQRRGLGKRLPVSPLDEALSELLGFLGCTVSLIKRFTNIFLLAMYRSLFLYFLNFFSTCLRIFHSRKKPGG